VSDDIYRRITARMWGDAKFRSLTPLACSGQAVWIVLLTGEQTGVIPGVFKIGEAAFAEQQKWDLDAFRHAFAEVSAKGMAVADWDARLVWVPNAIRHNPPASLNTIKSWRVAWSLLPECDLKFKSWQELDAFTEGMGDAWHKAFRMACPMPRAIQGAGSREQGAIEETASSQVLPSTSPPVMLQLPAAQAPDATSTAISAVPSAPPDAPGMPHANTGHAPGKPHASTGQAPGKPPLELQPVQKQLDTGTSSAEQVFEFWRSTMGKIASVKFSPERRKAVEARLKQGYTVAQLKQAVEGNRASPHHRGVNDTGTVYDDLELICRNATFVDKFIAYLLGPPPETPKPGGSAGARKPGSFNPDANHNHGPAGRRIV
jgi:hypothetical protein